MKVVWLAWYIGGVLLLMALMASAITYHPDIRYLGQILPAVFGAGAILTGGLAVALGRLPPNHRIHQSRMVWAACVAVAVAVTLLLILVG